MQLQGTRYSMRMVTRPLAQTMHASQLCMAYEKLWPAMF